ncbi:MAG: hypothetical protein ABIG92_01405 [Candidatus Omnitrophota bacterium]
MRKLFFFILILLVFLYTFLKSGAWETYKEENTSRGVPFMETKQDISWDRYVAYLKTIPIQLRKSLDISK